MKLKEIHRTSTFAWSPLPSIPLLATGTVAGALDESFSNESQLEIWAPDFLNKQEYDLGGEGQPGPRGVIRDTARFNRIAWGYVEGNRPQGIIAAGMENGELGIWDPEKIVAQADPSEALILKNNTHTGPIRGLDFNPIQTSLFSSGGPNGEIYIWDLKDPSKPYSPGTRSSKLDEITALSWNNQVPHVLATSSSTGYTVVWDLRGKREVVALAYGGGAGALAGARRGMSDVAWHPDNATKLVTSSEDDASPVIMVWDLRNARAPEKILTGHEKGVLSLSWCKQDADLLLSSGKDNRALCWNPQTSEIIGELPSADNWAFQVQWCPRNPDLLATAFFDGTIGVHSVQTTNEAAQGGDIPLTTPKPDGADVFDVPGFARTNQATISLKQPPKWLRRPISSSFGYGGQLVSVSNLPSAQGRHQSGVVHLRKVITEESIVARARKLQEAVMAGDLSGLAKERSGENEADESSATWKALLSLFKADSRDELVTLLGFSKAEIATKVAEAVAKLKTKVEDVTTPPPRSPAEQDVTETKPHEPVVSFVEPERSPSPPVEDPMAQATENTPSEVSAGGASDVTNVPSLAGESTTTAPSLFGDDNAAGTPQMDAAADFFSTMGISQTNNTAAGDSVQVPHTNYGLDSSVAATIGSGPSSVASETLKSNTFTIYPPDESETDRLVTKALVVGDFDSAVSLCLSTDRYADAILLAVKGGPALLAKTQKAYFEKRTAELPYLRLFQSIVTNDLDDIVQNADLQEWQEIFVVLCTFANTEEFPNLAEQLGSRLEFQGTIAKSKSSSPEAARVLRKNATLTYLAAGKLERLVNIWIEELVEEEKRILANEDEKGVSRYTAHAHALQSFIEKVMIFRAATSYADADLAFDKPSAEGENVAKVYKLSNLYERFFEYADLLATQGLVKDAVAFLKLTPAGYTGTPGSGIDVAVGRERLLVAGGQATATPGAGPSNIASTSRVPTLPSVPSAMASTNYSSYGQYAAPLQQQAPVAPAYGTYAPAATANNAYAPAVSATSAPPVNNPYAPSQPAVSQQPYQSSAPSAYGPSGGWNPQMNNNSVVPPPPQPITGSTPPAPGPAPPPKRQQQNGGWNDAPSLLDRRTPSTLGGNNANKPSAITSPFPNAPSTPGIGGGPTQFMGMRGQSPQTVMPPPRPGSVQNRAPVAPPPQGHRMGIPHPGQQQGPYPPQARPPSGPPMNMMSPPGQQMSSPPQGQYAPPPTQRGHVPPQMQQQASMSPPPPGPYGPPPGVRATPPPGAPMGLGMNMPPPGPGGPQQFGRPGPPPQQQQQHPGMGGQQLPPPPQGGLRPGPPGGVGPPVQSRTPGGGPSSVPPPRGPPPPKYPVGDRSHIPERLQPAYAIISGQLAILKQTTPPQQKRLVDDLERRINPLFDALNCETLSAPTVEQLLVLTKAMENHDRDAALQLHVNMLTSTSGDDIALWMSGIKQLIMRL
ncbi:uncharacterized protein STEHIDRAFT_103269 [Stereum hirsutum FP-91666 SS1]|uniref:uncharacterized protein n=1 Tax=Stereum hirsutum (strain FP-91666) TaxID=721885 RepID=UPI000444A63C|nr:uncharacterized protein STEHIDRAFT_103269 [Stereum hirsutum FP-91666 SS1]EIM81877.1 hypothetical protein STEHIDRAFT_103269 [Stereum hirsutum FP-91666 SS1]